MQDVALVENGSGGGAVDPEQDAVATVTGQQQPRQNGGFDFTVGGAGGDPVLTIPTSGGSIDLGHQDILLVVLLLDLGFRLAKFWMEVR